MPSPPPEDLPNPGFKPGSPTLQADSSPSELPGISYQLPRILEWLALPTPGELPDLEIEPGSPALQADSLTVELPFPSTQASIKQEKKALNMLMLLPLLGDI